MFEMVLIEKNVCNESVFYFFVGEFWVRDCSPLGLGLVSFAHEAERTSACTR